ncbi:SUF system NifU family Fe-S cluster assembly protein [Sesbania bispinosa]|nr:SUF system NifU family Fe-S cluster assembly protein [Sesbania bispinosa]
MFEQASDVTMVEQTPAEMNVYGGVGGAELNAQHLISTLTELVSNTKMIIKRQDENDEKIKFLIAKVGERQESRIDVNQGSQSGRNISSHDDKPRNREGFSKTNWDNIKLEPFPSEDTDDYYVDVSDDEGYFHDMGIKKNKTKLSTQSAPSLLGPNKGQSFIKSEHDMFYNMEKGKDLTILANSFRRGNMYNGTGAGKDWEQDDKSSIQPRKLSLTPPDRSKKPKFIDLDPPKKCTPWKSGGLKDRNGIEIVAKDKNIVSNGRPI